MLISFDKLASLFILQFFYKFFVIIEKDSTFLRYPKHFRTKEAKAS